MKGPVFVALGENGLRAVSQDAVHYEQFETLQWPPSFYYPLFLNGTLLACGGARYGGRLAISRTRDGEHWDYFELENVGGRAHGGFVLGDKYYVFNGTSDRGLGNLPQILSSKDGETWSEPIKLGFAGQGPEHTGPTMRVAAVGPDRVVAVGDFGRRMVSMDGEKWAEAEWNFDQPERRLSLLTVAYGNGVYVAAGLHGLRVASVDGYRWDEPVLGLEGEHINNLFFDGNQFIAVGHGANYLSRDGRQWQRVENREAPPLVTYGGGKFVGFNWPARVFVSENAVDWQMVGELKQDIGGMGYGELGG